MNNSVFIENEKLGILDSQVRELTTPTSTKRARQLNFRRIARIIRDLRLVPVSNRPIVYLSHGVNAAGEIGLLVMFESPDKEVGVVMPQTPAAVRVCNKTAYCILPEGHLGNCHIAIPT